MPLRELYQALFELYGPQGWWPVDLNYHNLKGTDPREEIIIGAILTQNTSWKNVERALDNIKSYGELSFRFIRESPIELLKELIKPTGFYNQKAKRLKEFCMLFKSANELENISREELLKAPGVGEETADSILLYAFNRLSFVIDKYTFRFIYRYMGITGNYSELKKTFERQLPKDLQVYKEFHALIDHHAKYFCKSAPRCEACMLKNCLRVGLSF
ncbi:MAG: endonuclease III domain-containing protein [Aquificaceae bacterium]|nr:endonuclease III domain-containing protein [Aquificaceae bacterium]MDW8237012.1 endonuclease III domain-containing protein [Aquificaceae bacterium]